MTYVAVLTEVSRPNHLPNSGNEGDGHPQNRVMNIGAAIRKVRLEKGLTLEAVALDAETYAGNLSKVERAQQLPSLDLLHKLSEALGTKTSALYALAE